MPLGNENGQLDRPLGNKTTLFCRARTDADDGPIETFFFLFALIYMHFLALSSSQSSVVQVDIVARSELRSRLLSEYMVECCRRRIRRV